MSCCNQQRCPSLSSVPLCSLLFQHMNINYLAKNPQMSNIRILTGEDFFRSLLIQSGMMTSILNIYISTNNFFLERSWKVLITHHISSSLANCHVLPFHNLILLRVLRYSHIHLNSFFPIEIIKISGSVFTSII